MSKHTANQSARTANAAQTTYEGTVIFRAMERAGKNPHLKGHIHEVLVKDMRNLNPRNILNGQVSELTKSTTAKTVDIVTTRAGKVVERLQVKDAPASIDKLVQQVKSGQYRSAQLIGSEETAQAFNEAAKAQGLTKTMQSSGVSSKTTESLAQRAGATGSGTMLNAVGKAAKTGGTVGAVVGAGIEAVSGVCDLLDGTRDLNEVVIATGKAGVKGGVTGAASGAAATVAGAATAAGIGAIGATGVAAAAATFAVPVAAAVAVGYAVSEVFDWLFD